MERRTEFKLSAEQIYKTFNNFELSNSTNFDIWCCGGRMAADVVGLFFDVTQCGETTFL